MLMKKRSEEEEKKFTEILETNLSRKASKKFIKFVNESKEGKKIIKLPKLNSIHKRIQSAGEQNLKASQSNFNDSKSNFNGDNIMDQSKFNSTKESIKIPNKLHKLNGKPPIYKINKSIQIGSLEENLNNTTENNNKNIILNEIISHEELKENKKNYETPQNKKNIRLQKPPRLYTSLEDKNLAKLLNRQSSKKYENNPNNIPNFLNLKNDSTIFPKINTSYDLEEKSLVGQLYFKEIETTIPLKAQPPSISSKEKLRMVEKEMKMTMSKNLSSSVELKTNSTQSTPVKEEGSRKLVLKLPKFRNINN